MHSHELQQHITALCREIAAGNYDKAKTLFDLQPVLEPGTPEAVFVEALAMMLVRIEAREFESNRLLARLAKNQALLARHNKTLRAKLKTIGLHTLVAKDAATLLLMQQAQRAAVSDANLLITGETGTGKGFLARYIHSLGSRSAKPFIAINCAAIPGTLLESELFGIEAGVASGVTAREGRFEQASGGTVFLDEIGDMPLDCQPKILHVIETGTLERVGGRKAIPVDVRIIAATHQNLEECVAKKQFREDLFYRLNVIRLHVPPLRERRDDLPFLTELILSRLAGESPEAVTDIRPEALELLLQYHWPGNIRQLENELERAAFLARGKAIQPGDLHLGKSVADPAPPFPGGAPHFTPVRGQEYSPPIENLPFDGAVPGLPDSPLSLREAERAHILRVLQMTGGNKSKAAQILDISREGLRLKLKHMNTE